MAARYARLNQVSLWRSASLRLDRRWFTSEAPRQPMPKSSTEMNTNQQALTAKPALIPLLLGIVLLTSAPAEAQRRPGGVGFGGQIGEPSGVTIKVYNPNAVSYDFLAAWNLDDFFYLNVHGVYERHLNDEGSAHFFFGPGGFVGLRDRPRDEDDDVVLGISGTFGVNYFIERAELFAQVTPRLSLVPDTDGDVGGGIGVRFYFGS